MTASTLVNLASASLIMLGAAGAAACQETRPEPFTPMLPPAGTTQAAPPAPEPFTPVLPPKQAAQPQPAQPSPHSHAWYNRQPGHTDAEPGSNTGLVADIKAYVTAPLHWDGNDWAWFGGALAAIGASHHYDTQVRRHFTYNLTDAQIRAANTHDAKDALPAAAVLGLTWGYATLIGDSSGHREAWDMLESAGLSVASSYVFKYATRRQRPDETADPNAWEKSGGNSFPSLHSAAAFAIGTVLAESGNDDYRWIRRILGYGLGAATSYERLRHNAHWLSDTVAGTALGIATAHFVINRHDSPGSPQAWSVTPVPGGAMLTYNRTMD